MRRRLRHRDLQHETCIEFIDATRGHTRKPLILPCARPSPLSATTFSGPANLPSCEDPLARAPLSEQGKQAELRDCSTSTAACFFLGKRRSFRTVALEIPFGFSSASCFFFREAPFYGNSECCAARLLNESSMVFATDSLYSTGWEAMLSA